MVPSSLLNVLFEKILGGGACHQKPPQAAAYLLTQLHSLTTFKNASDVPLMYTCKNCSLATISMETPTATTDQ